MKEASKTNWFLKNALEQSKQHPDTFEIPPQHQRQNLQARDLVKLIFTQKESANDTISTEHMWVDVVSKDGKEYTGVLNNDPMTSMTLKRGDIVYFTADHVIAIG